MVPLLLSPGLQNIYLLEFHPSLGLAARIPKALDQLLLEAHRACGPPSASSLVLLEQCILRLALDLCLSPAQPETWYSARLQTDVSSFSVGLCQKGRFPPDVTI